MLYGTLKGLDKPVSRLVQGTVMVTSQNKESFRLLDEVFELGCTAFDTAHVYGNGDCERTFGRWLRERGVREEVVILGKGAHPDGARARVTPEDITRDLEESLERLETDTIDLYLLHRDDPSVPVGPIVETLNEHRAAGRIRAFGGSNWTHERVQEANAYADAHGLEPFAASSPNFSLAEQVNPPWAGCVSIGGRRGEAARAYYERTQLPLFTWSSLAGGFFSGRFTRENLGSFESYLDKLCVKSYGVEENFQRLDRVRVLAEEKGLSVPQVALAYILSQPLNIFALVGCASGAEFRDNLEVASAGGARLSPEEIAWLELRAGASTV